MCRKTGASASRGSAHRAGSRLHAPGVWVSRGLLLKWALAPPARADPRPRPGPYTALLSGLSPPPALRSATSPAAGSRGEPALPSSLPYPAWAALLSSVGVSPPETCAITWASFPPSCLCRARRRALADRAQAPLNPGASVLPPAPPTSATFPAYQLITGPGCPVHSLPLLLFSQRKHFGGSPCHRRRP